MIGAGVTYRELERSDLVAEVQPELSRVAGRIANPRVRNVGSIGGNLCFAEPHSDVAAYLLAAEATIRLESGEAERELSVEAFIVDALETALGPGELLPVHPTAAGFAGHGHRPPPPGVRRAAGRDRHLPRALGRDVVAEARVVVGSVASHPALAPRTAAELVGVGAADLGAAAASAAATLADEITVQADGGSSAEYRRHLAKVLFVRALADARPGRDGR